MHQIFFKGKLNRDVTAKFIGDDYVDAENIIFQVSKEGEGGLLRLYNGFLKGDQDPLSPTEPTGEYIVNEFIDGTLINGDVYKIEQMPNGKILAVGNFSPNRIVLFNSDGSIDNSFNSGTGFNNIVSDFQIQPDNKILAVGSFTEYNGTTANRIVRLDTDGTIDSSFNTGSGYSTIISSVDIDSSGNFVIVGQNGLYKDALSSSSVWRILPNGNIDSSFTETFTGTFFKVKIQSDGKILLGSSGAGGIRRVESDGTADATFTPFISAGSSVFAIDIDSSNRIYVGGNLIGSFFARMTSSGANESISIIPNDVVRFINIIGNELYVGGLFTLVNSESRIGFFLGDTSGNIVDINISVPFTRSFIKVGDNFILGGSTSVNGNWITTFNEEFTSVIIPNEAKVIGVCEDKPKSLLYYFVKGSFDGIYRYNQIANEFSLIFTWDGLNFSSFIQSGLIGNFLYWTDNINQPRYINVTRIYTDITEDDITLIRPAPLLPLVTGGFNGYATFSSLSGFGYQFSYRYVYLDNQISVIAPWTKTFYVSDNTEFISVARPSDEDIPKYVRVVELLVRRNDEDFWQVFITTTPSNFQNSSFFFSGDQLGKSVSSIETTKPFENIPLKSKTIEIARDRVFLANNLEGYDLVSIPSLSATLSQDDISLPPVIGTVYRRRITSLIGDVPNGNYTVRIEDDYYVRTEDRYYFLVLGGITEEEFILGVSQGVNTVRVSAYTGLETELEDEQSNFFTQNDLVNYPVTPDPNVILFRSLQQVDPLHQLDLIFNIIPALGSTKFKNKSQYRIGIVFYDRYLRNAGVYTNSNCIVTVNDDFRNNVINSLRWSIDPSEAIPEWAESYQIVRTDNLTRVNFFQGQTSDILWVYFETGDAKYSRTYRADAEFVEIDISGSFKAGQRYNFSQGDRIDIESGGNIFTYNIIGFAGSRLRIAPISNEIFETTISPFPVRLYYEVYTPRFTTEDVIFYEVGEAYKIANAGQPSRFFSVTSGFFTGDVTVLEINHFDYPDARTPATGDLPPDDLESTPVTIVIESRNPDNNPDVGWIKDIGRPNAILDLGQVRKDSAIRYSNRFIQGTRVNGTSNFDFGDEDLVGLENGQINKLALVSKQQREGTVMLCVCEQEALSIYLGETQIVDNEGGQVVGSTQNVIGTIRGMAGGFGTKHAESVVVHEGRAWWWDVYSWRVVRYDTNGIRPISDIGMKSYFYGKNGNPVTGFDPFHQLFFIGFDNEQKVISFDENENGWRSFYDFMPDFMGKVNEFMVSFRDGFPFRSNHTTLATYFDSPKDGLYEFYTVSPKPEILENVCLYTTENVFTWNNGVQEMDDKFLVEITNEKGQETSLKPSDFDILESVPYAHVLRDINSGGLLQGEEMRNDINKFTLTLWDDIGFEMLIINKQESSGHI
jgi:uncharacterized delta-60 repeat protein